MFWVLKKNVSLRRFFCIPKNICFGWEIRIIIFSYSLLSGGLHDDVDHDDGDDDHDHDVGMSDITVK